MIVRSLASPSVDELTNDEPQPAFQAFLETQREVEAPYAILFQAEHARLSGALARALSPNAFGVLPPDVTEAISAHDAGWDESDAAQFEQLSSKPPRSFPTLSTEDTIPSWRRCIEHAQGMGDLAAVLIARHFEFVGSSEPDRKQFLQIEAHFRQQIEAIRHFAKRTGPMDGGIGVLRCVVTVSLLGLSKNCRLAVCPSGESGGRASRNSNCVLARRVALFFKAVDRIGYSFRCEWVHVFC